MARQTAGHNTDACNLRTWSNISAHAAWHCPAVPAPDAWSGLDSAGTRSPAARGRSAWSRRPRITV